MGKTIGCWCRGRHGLGIGADLFDCLGRLMNVIESQYLPLFLILSILGNFIWMSIRIFYEIRVIDQETADIEAQITEIKNRCFTTTQEARPYADD